jgi:glucose 1-dehydrogenase
MASFLAAEDSDYVTGTTVFLDGGLLWNYQEQ